MTLELRVRGLSQPGPDEERPALLLGSAPISVYLLAPASRHCDCLAELAQLVAGLVRRLGHPPRPSAFAELLLGVLAKAGGRPLAERQAAAGVKLEWVEPLDADRVRLICRAGEVRSELISGRTGRASGRPHNGRPENAAASGWTPPAQHGCRLPRRAGTRSGIRCLRMARPAHLEPQVGGREVMTVKRGGLGTRSAVPVMTMALAAGLTSSCGSTAGTPRATVPVAASETGAPVLCTRDVEPAASCEAAATRTIAALVVETTARAAPVSDGWRVDLQVTVVAADGAAHLVEDEPIRCSGSAIWIGEGWDTAAAVESALRPGPSP